MQEQNNISGKYKKVIEVHTKDGKTYQRVQMVGSDMQPMQSKHHGLNTLFDKPEDQNKYHEHLKNLIPHEGKYYKLHQKKNVSQGRTSFGSGTYEGATRYELHPIEQEYKKHLDKEHNINHDDKQKRLETALYNDRWYGNTDTKHTKAYDGIVDRSKKTNEELHKEAKTDTGNKIIEKEQKELSEKEKLQAEKDRQHNEYMHDTISKNINEKIANYNYKTSTVKDFNSFINMDIRRYGLIKPDTKVYLMARNGQEKERTWKQMRDWLQKEVQSPFDAGQPLPFLDMRIDFGENPHKLKT